MSAAIDAALDALATTLRASTVAVRVGRSGSGSGVVWSTNGAIVTNAHVATEPVAEVLLADGRTFAARLERRDVQRDLALLRIDAADLQPVTVRDPATLRVGEVLVAFGHPMGVANALTMGIAHRPFGAGSRRFVSADVRLAPGNSGGPLADVEGRVVGINSISVGGDLAFAVPSDDVERFLGTARSDARLGVRLAAARLPDNRDVFVVTEVEPGSRAERAGVRFADVLLAHDVNRLRTTTTLDVLRGGVPTVLVVPATHGASLAA
jgi:serine protease Do